MCKIIGAAALILYAITPVLGDATEAIDAKSAVEFVLSTCLPAMDDVANLEAMAREMPARKDQPPRREEQFRRGALSIQRISFEQKTTTCIVAGCRIGTSSLREGLLFHSPSTQEPG